MNKPSNKIEAKGEATNESPSGLQVVKLPAAEVMADYRCAFVSRQASLIGRKEVLSGKAKFGIFGDGKEVAQIAMARAFQKGDWRAGYYRDQTFMMAVGALDVKKFFAQLFADPDLKNEPASGGRQMNNHFATRYLDDNGQWLNQCMMYNTSSDISPTGGQMARLLGLAYASKLYRQQKDLSKFSQFSVNGNEVAFGTIGNASTSEGVFWETINAAGVLQVPMAMSVWDDGYGISVPNKYQTTKESISELLRGYQQEKGSPGFDIYVAKGWDYPTLIDTYQRGIEKCRRDHVPALFHIIEVTQPQGHSTSGSHERYKNAERMAWEESTDCIARMRTWMIKTGVSTEQALSKLEKECTAEVEKLKQEAWDDYTKPIESERKEVLEIYTRLAEQSDSADVINSAKNDLARSPNLFRRTIHASMRRLLVAVRDDDTESKRELIRYLENYEHVNERRYSSHHFSESTSSPLGVSEVKPIWVTNPEKVDGRQVIQKFFDIQLKRDPRVFIVGEDIGKLGGVNLEFDGLQEKHGELRVTDTGIREMTIFGQGLGAAMRGLRPVVDIQYLDYLLYCFQGMSDDLATLHYRTAGGQIAPVIVRTKGHRLEGVWHSGSPMGMILHGIRGIHVCVPRNMVQAAGMYNTLFQGDDPALVIEVLNGYRVKELMPENIGTYTVPLGVPEILISGTDVTLLTYGACVRIAQDAVGLLESAGVSVELIDIQTLLPFDRFSSIIDSVKKTNAVVFLDEDVPGGATSFMMQDVLERQGGYEHLDAAPRTITAKAHRAAYASDGDYYSKPSAEDVFDSIYGMMMERRPHDFPAIR